MDTHATARRPWQALDAARRLPRPYFLVVLLALMHTDLAHAFSLPFSLGASRFLARGVASNGGLLADAFGGRARPATLSQLSMSGGRGGGRGGRGGSRGRGGGGSTTSTGRFPVPTAPKAQDRAGMSRKDWDLASTIGGPKKSAQQLAQLLGLAKVEIAEPSEPRSVLSVMQSPIRVLMHFMVLTRSKYHTPGEGGPLLDFRMPWGLSSRYWEDFPETCIPGTRLSLKQSSGDASHFL